MLHLSWRNISWDLILNANQVCLSEFRAVECLGVYGFMKRRGEIYSSHNPPRICPKCLTASKQVVTTISGLKPPNIVFFQHTAFSGEQSSGKTCFKVYFESITRFSHILKRTWVTFVHSKLAGMMLRGDCYAEADVFSKCSCYACCNTIARMFFLPNLSSAMGKSSVWSLKKEVARLFSTNRIYICSTNSVG